MNANAWMSPNSRISAADRDEHRDRRPERGPGRGAQHVRVRERIPEQALERRAGDRQRHRPTTIAGQYPGQAEVHHDRLGRRRPGGRDVQPEQAATEDRRGCRPRGIATVPSDDPRARGRPPAAPAPPARSRRAGARDRPARNGPARAARIAEPRRRRSGPRASGWRASTSARRPSARRGPGRVTRMNSSIGQTAPSFTAVMPAQPGRAATSAAVV